MNRMNRKKTLLLLIAVLSLAILTGCPQDTEKGAGQNDTDAPPQQEETIQPAAQDEPSPDASEQQTEQLFDALEINIEKGNLDICAGDSFSYVRKDGGEAEYEITDGVLCIDQRQDHKTVLTLPEGLTYTSLRLTAGESHVYLGSALSLQTLELNVSRGEVDLSGIAVTDSSVIEVSQGSAFLSGDLGNSVAAHSKEGHLSMELSAAQDDYNFEIDLLTGNIHLGTEDYHGLSVSKSIDNGAERSMELNCSRGDLSVEFDVQH